MKNETIIQLSVLLLLLFGFASGYWMRSAMIDTETFDFESVRCFNISDSLDGSPKWREVCIDGLDNYVVARLEKLVRVA